jgi:hypothetical protein
MTATCKNDETVMPKIIIVPGEKVGKLTVVERQHPLWFCLCICGKTVMASTSRLVHAKKHGVETSCGCWKNKMSSERLKESNPILKRTHGHATDSNGNSHTYTCWRGAKKRCYQPSHDSYPRYGGAGKFMCDRWKNSYPEFLLDMGECPPEKSLDRIDNKGNYTCGKCPQCIENGWPANGKWSTQKEQARNRSSNTIYEVQGHKGCIAELAEHFKISDEAALERIRRKWSIEDAFTTPVGAARPIKTPLP